MMHITFIGGGNMATAIIAGLTKARGCQISVVEPNADKRAQLAQQFGVTTQEQLPVYFGSGQIVVLAVKPQQLREVCGGLASRLDGALVLSIAAGVGVSALSRWLDGHERIVRIMPNTPAMIGKGFLKRVASSIASNCVLSPISAIATSRVEVKKISIGSIPGPGRI